MGKLPRRADAQTGMNAGACFVDALADRGSHVQTTEVGAQPTLDRVDAAGQETVHWRGVVLKRPFEPEDVEQEELLSVGKAQPKSQLEDPARLPVAEGHRRLS